MTREPNEDELTESGERSANINQNDEVAGPRIELWTRRPVSGPRTEVIDHLASLQSSGQIADFCIETWPDEVIISEETPHPEAVETYERFRTWAEQTGVSISPPFTRRTFSTLAGQRDEVVTLPMLCLAVYEEELLGVYPCTVGDETVTVMDFVEACGATEETPTPTDLTLSSE